MTRKEIIRFIGTQEFGGFTFFTKNFWSNIWRGVVKDQPVTATVRTDRTPAAKPNHGVTRLVENLVVTTVLYLQGSQRNREVAHTCTSRKPSGNPPNEV
jgi:hypothetical protein